MGLSTNLPFKVSDDIDLKTSIVSGFIRHLVQTGETECSGELFHENDPMNISTVDLQLWLHDRRLGVDSIHHMFLFYIFRKMIYNSNIVSPPCKDPAALFKNDKLHQAMKILTGFGNDPLNELDIDPKAFFKEFGLKSYLDDLKTSPESLEKFFREAKDIHLRFMTSDAKRSISGFINLIMAAHMGSRPIYRSTRVVDHKALVGVRVSENVGRAIFDIANENV